jgi:hypothetical protein
MKLSVKTEINPTESREKLLQACENVFPNVEFKEQEGFFVGKGEERNDLAELKELLKEEHIRATAKAFLGKRIGDGRLAFNLNKQAASMGKANFVDFPIALGTIEVTLQDEDLEGLVEWLCG